MAELRYVGPDASAPEDLGYLAYLAERASSGSMSPQEIDARIRERFATYATKDYVDLGDAGHATKAYVEARDNERIDLSTINQPGGVAGLGPNGRIGEQYLRNTGQQRLPVGPIAPFSYGLGGIGSKAESLMTVIRVDDPGYPYRVLAFGSIVMTLAGNTGELPSQLTVNRPALRMRLGSSTGPVIASGVARVGHYGHYGFDDFKRTADSLGEQWEVTASHGQEYGYIATNGESAYWRKRGASQDPVWMCRRLGNDAVTYNDNQIIDWYTSTDSDNGSAFGASGVNYILGRMSEDGLYWAGWKIATHTAQFVWRAGGAIQESGIYSVSNVANSHFRADFGAIENPREFRLYRNGVPVATYVDTGNQTRLGGMYRGWGFGMSPGFHEFAIIYPHDQAAPAALDWIRIFDGDQVQNTGLSASPVQVVPISIADQPVTTGTTYVHVMMTVVGPDNKNSQFEPDRMDHHLSVVTVPA